MVALLFEVTGESVDPVAVEAAMAQENVVAFVHGCAAIGSSTSGGSRSISWIMTAILSDLDVPAKHHKIVSTLNHTMK